MIHNFEKKKKSQEQQTDWDTDSLLKWVEEKGRGMVAKSFQWNKQLSGLVDKSAR